MLNKGSASMPAFCFVRSTYIRAAIFWTAAAVAAVDGLYSTNNTTTILLLLYVLLWCCILISHYCCCSEWVDPLCIFFVGSYKGSAWMPAFI